jgi:FlaA1/EpsC-like NDP-sugar epimerase
MGSPVKIADLARDLIRLSGKEPERDIAIIYTGLRPGEKLFEELITHGEGIVPTAHQKIMVLRPNGNANASHYAQCMTGLDQLAVEAGSHDAPKIKLALQRLVPEYVLSASPSVLCEVPSRGTAGSEC